MTILVTRPSPAGEKLVSRLRALGRVAYSFPLIEFSPGRQLEMLPNLLANLRNDDLAFVLSQHVVRYAQPLMARKGLHWPEDINWFAIGRTTALAFHTVSHLPVLYPFDRETSEVLLQLSELQNVAGKRALIMRGNGGREMLGEVLTARGVTVEFCECYQRSAIVYDGTEEAFRWRERGITTLVVTSGEMLHQLYTLVPEWYRINWLLHCQLVVVSERLAIFAQDLGWQDIRIANNADNDALLRALQ